MTRHDIRFRLSALLLLLLSSLFLVGCGAQDPAQNTTSDEAAENEESSSSNRDLPGDIFIGDTVTGSAPEEGELIDLLVNVPDEDVVTIRLSGDTSENFGQRLLTTSTIEARAGDENPPEVATEEGDGTYVVVYDTSETKLFFILFRAIGDYSVTLEAGNTLDDES